MQTNVIERITRLVETACGKKTNHFGYGIWSHHILPMSRLAPELARLHEADEEIVAIAVLLHDYAGIKDPEMVAQHHVHGAEEARALLSEAGYPQERIEIIADAILNHRGSVPGLRKTAEARCLADCDAIVHLQELPSLLRMAYAEKGMGIDEGARWVLQKVERDWTKLSPIGKRYIRSTYQAAISILGTSADPSPSDE
jgi:predicted hydrolase (HD superfamily)